MIKEFTQAVCERIGYYVYILKEPVSQQIFYVGKGKNNRIFNHVQCALDTELLSDKLDEIRKIGAGNVQHYILRHGLTEEQALEIESACIDLLGLENLKNEVNGHHSWVRGLKSIAEVIQHYDAQVITVDKEEPSIIININRLYERFMDDEKLYNATRSSWVVGPKRNLAKYAFAAYRGLVREVYNIHEWHHVGGRRWEFTGSVAEPEIRDKYINQSLSNYMKKGSQNPIKYTF
ncbi:LEM-3-like GIY-YIG domain-containing protein [Pontibacter indicus]|uniref:GIY-YIG domain-containing protein n=1 Tax=Pontibacter indicus TaxID=1317125 RepID=A0A1R3X2C9_9BACT|nr:hypothetical protein [Pontibacter indicus]SIT84371.1 hypothetical protein SAMN05444128_1391 [Pontibacter indicus]